jgi:serine/threonine protein kinase
MSTLPCINDFCSLSIVSCCCCMCCVCLFVCLFYCVCSLLQMIMATFVLLTLVYLKMSIQMIRHTLSVVHRNISLLVSHLFPSSLSVLCSFYYVVGYIHTRVVSQFSHRYLCLLCTSVPPLNLNLFVLLSQSRLSIFFAHDIEIVTGAGHDKAVDWWSLGILLYELTVGIPPFYSQNVNEMYSKIQHGVLRFPPFLSDACKSLIVGVSASTCVQQIFCFSSTLIEHDKISPP